ncbi:MAG: hypothetical protein ACI9K4_000570, partial [Polaribacter sp.]
MHSKLKKKRNFVHKKEYKIIIYVNISLY